ncbi:MAG: tetratricopeptide repeat protein [Phaeodactylibacter sp.]|nr:tetratricopeptide repeat protein [Phaeodactylibacter sp.]MCB9272893.1 tetratricopeptide repeat protein [Lewinellaceae bacterium]
MRFSRFSPFLYKGIYSLFLAAMASVALHAQNQQLEDSLLLQLRLAPDDTSRLNQLGKLVQMHLWADAEKALVYAFQADSLAQETGIPEEMARTKNYIGMCYYTGGKTEKAIEYYLLSLEQYEALHDTLYIGILYNNIAAGYQLREKHDETLDYYRKALSFFEQKKDLLWAANVTNNIANVYFFEGNLMKARDHYQRAYERFVELKDTTAQAYALKNMCNIYIKWRELPKAIDMAKQALALIDPAFDPRTVAGLKRSLGEAYLLQGKHARAKACLDEALSQSRTYLAREEEKAALETLSLYYETTGDHRRALEVYKAFASVKDSIFNQAKDQAMLEMLTRYETEKKDREISLLSTEKEINTLRLQQAQRQKAFFAIGALLLAAVASSLFFLYRLKQKTTRELQQKNRVIAANLAEKETLLKEIHHRVKNNLQIVSSLLRLQARHVDDAAAQEALREGQSRIRSMSLIHQNLYQEDNLIGVNVRDYLSKLTESLFYSYNIKPGKVHLQLDIDELVLDVDTLIPLGLIINELLTNALKYAFPGERCGDVNLKLKAVGPQLLLEIGDNGVGITAEAGRQNTFGRQLVHTFAQKLSAEWNIESQEQDGTQVRMLIPKQKRA